MEKDFFFTDSVFTDSENINYVFHRTLYYEFLCKCITDIFEQKLDKDKHIGILNILSTLEDSRDVAYTTHEIHSYWIYLMMGKLENGYAEYNQMDPKKNEEIYNFYVKFLSDNKIYGFIEEIHSDGLKNSGWL
jgi:hypothetical protein